MASGGSSPFFGEEVMAITSGGDARTLLPPKILKPLRKPSPFLFSKEEVILNHLLEVGGNGRTKKKEGEERMILTRNNPFDFDGDLKR